MEAIINATPVDQAQGNAGWMPAELKNPVVWGAAAVGMTVGVVGVGLYARHQIKKAHEELETAKLNHATKMAELSSRLTAAASASPAAAAAGAPSAAAAPAA